MSITIYHNPRCSKSRATLALLRDNGHEPEVIEYLSETPSAEELNRICEMLECEPLDIMRTKEGRFKELGLSKKDIRSREEWFIIMEANPILIERPVVINGNRAAVGRPPENVLTIL